MTSPNRETEAQQVTARVEHQIALTKVKASLREKKGEIGVNLAVRRIITDQEQEAETAMPKILKPGHQEMATAIISDQEQAVMVMLKILKQDRQEMVKEVTSNPEMAKEAALDQEQAEMVRLKISNQDHQETVKEATSSQEAMETALSDRKAREAQEARQVSNRVHLKKAVQEKSLEMKAAVISRKTISVQMVKDHSELSKIKNAALQEVQTADLSEKEKTETHCYRDQNPFLKTVLLLHQQCVQKEKVRQLMMERSV